MSTVPLSNEENYVIFAGNFTDTLTSLGATQQEQVLKKIRQLISSDTPRYFIYEQVQGCDELEIIRAGGALRIYCRLVMGIPQENKQYNILYVLYVDQHKYRSDVLQRYDTTAQQVLKYATSLDNVADVDEYLEEMDALDEDDLNEMLN